MRSESLTAKDGTRLAIHTTGEGAMRVMLANGLGGPFFAWKPILDHFAAECRFHSWDYRGLYGSQAPEDRGTLSVECAVKDQIEVMDRFGLDRVLLGGWSMGVQVALEFYRRHPDRVSGMILLNGTYGKIFRTAFRSRVSPYLLPRALKIMRKIAPLGGPLIKGLAHWPGTVPVASALGLVDPRIDRDVFKKVAWEFGGLDMDLYFESLLNLSEHDAEDVLCQVEVPVLIIAGERDLMTPPDVTAKMLQEMRRADLFVVPHGSHYCLLEYPDMVAGRVRRFLEENYAAELGAASAQA